MNISPMTQLTVISGIPNVETTGCEHSSTSQQVGAEFEQFFRQVEGVIFFPIWFGELFAGCQFGVFDFWNRLGSAGCPFQRSPSCTSNAIA